MASISHELKNRIAIMKEHAGLLKDYSEMAAQGREINMDRMGQLGHALGEQVSLADDILKNMNQLAHSVDEFVRTSDLDDILRLSTALASRPANQHRVELQILPPESSISVTTAPLFLLNLLWLCLMALFRFGDKPRTVALSTERTDAGQGLIRMRMQDVEAKAETPFVLPTALKPLTDVLEADVDWETAENELRIYLPIDLSKPGRLDDLGLMPAQNGVKYGHD